jgi:hypothetical protein
VAVDIPLLGTLLSLPGDGRIREHPGHARVTFRHLLLPLMGVVYGSGKRSDGIWYSLMSAEATVL